MDADAISGSVNFVTKVPEGSPKGYVSAQAGQTTLLNNHQWQGGVSYGGRYGERQQLGVLVGASLDHNNRVISDVEPAWGVDGSGNVFPTEWSQRQFLQNRTRAGVGGDLDYRYGKNSTVFLKGLFSHFDDYGYRYQYDVSFAGDSAASTTQGYGTGAALFREVQNRTPSERLFGFTFGSRNQLGPTALDYSIDWAGTRQVSTDYRFNPFNYTASPNGLTMAYDLSSPTTPTYRFLTQADAAASLNPSNYTLNGYHTYDSYTSGADLGGAANLLRHYSWGNNTGDLKTGVRIRSDDSRYDQSRYHYSTSASLNLSQALSNFTNPNYYRNVTRAYTLGPLPANGATFAFVNGNHFAVNPDDSVANAVASFNGSEKIYAAYAMNTVDAGAWRINLGLRIEQTHSNYTGHVAQTPVDTLGNKIGSTNVTTVQGSETYTDLFPSAQVRLALGPETNLRAAITLAIARPNYSDLAPSVVGNVNFALKSNFGNLSAGNPDLHPQHAWNYDLLAEHFLPFGGVISGGLFYKNITDFIFQRYFIYNGPVAAFQGYGGRQPQNGGSARLLGFDGDWTEHLTFLSGLLSSTGFDVNWTRTDSRADVPVGAQSGGVTRRAALPRQAKNLANVSFLYDKGNLSARLA